MGGSTVELPLRRVCAAVGVQLRWAEVNGSPEHWSFSLPAPAAMALQLTHSRLPHHLVSSLSTDAAGAATLDGAMGICVGEQFTLSVPATETSKAASVDFTVSSSASGQCVPVSLERKTQDVTLALKARGTLSGERGGATPAVPRGLRYAVRHLELNREVTAGFTDQVGKAVLQRKSTLFVGQKYQLSVAPGRGLQAASKDFVVSAHHQEVSRVLAFRPWEWPSSARFSA